jgi:hypothetical protein
VGLGFDVVSVKQMTATRWSPSEESKIINLPLFLVTCRGQQGHRKFFVCLASATLLSWWKLIELRRSNPVPHLPAVRPRLGNCKMPPRCLCCGGGHLHKECSALLESVDSKPHERIRPRDLHKLIN